MEKTNWSYFCQLIFCFMDFTLGRGIAEIHQHLSELIRDETGAY